ncbi:MAG: hypothetical protein F6J86_08990 [Symploca sp. SIO1B1]|nr:hypothetical protein [Symploca sp. SIO1C2]NER93962.1 hypothetical protein [Symploca sp. SIO1B1]
MFNSLLWTNSIDPNESLEDEELLKLLIEYLAQPQQGKLEPFAPVVINILHSWLQQSNLQGDI